MVSVCCISGKFNFCSVLREKSHGVPSWCEQLLKEMFYEETIVIVPEKKRQEYLPKQQEPSVAPNIKYMQRRVSTWGGGMPAGTEVSYFYHIGIELHYYRTF